MSKMNFKKDNGKLNLSPMVISINWFSLPFVKELVIICLKMQESRQALDEDKLALELIGIVFIAFIITLLRYCFAITWNLTLWRIRMISIQDFLRHLPKLDISLFSQFGITILRTKHSNFQECLHSLFKISVYIIMRLCHSGSAFSHFRLTVLNFSPSWNWTVN